jgi:hypothetical protein
MEDTYKGQVDNPLSLNRYTYTHNNPLRFVDPSGHRITAANLYGANIVLNELKGAWRGASATTRLIYEAEAAAIRAQMSAKGYTQDEILQAYEPYITMGELKQTANFGASGAIINSGVAFGGAIAKVELTLGMGNFKVGNQATAFAKINIASADDLLAQISKAKNSLRVGLADMKLSRELVMEAARKFTGSTGKVSTGRIDFASRNGLNKVRMMYKVNNGRWEANFESYIKNEKGRIEMIKNYHIELD